MSIEIQKRIKDNATSVSDFFSDLYKWTEDQEKEERRRQIRKTAQQAGVNEAQKLLVAKPAESTPAVKVDDEVQDDRSDAIRRDRNPMAQYYNDWDQYDPDAEVDKIEDEAFQQQRAEREARQAEKDRILDEMALKPNGDRTRTTTARPRVKISVRRSGRRVAPVDLAAPRKDEANRLFGAGRYREAIAAYTAALDCLEKYEPPEAPGRAVRSTADGGRDQEDSCGQEQEAIALKVALLANRALACFKLEDWRECVVDASEALRFEPLHHKATLRRGFALARMKRWGPAAKDLDRAVSVDPADKKASAELQMVRRMLAEQAKEARAHAKCVMCDPTRDPTMPTRKLVVKVQRGEVDRAERVEAAEREEKDLRKPPEEAEAPPAPAESPAPRSRPAARAYVPRSVGLRGGRPEASQSQGARAAMSFYQFEAQWNRLRGKPLERAGLLEKVGSSVLPALFRESLDSELVSGIAEALAARLHAGPTRFAVDVLGALSRTPRFELSIHCLTAKEHALLDEVLSKLQVDFPEEIEALSSAYRPPKTSDGLMELDEDDVAEDAPAAAAPAAPAAAAAAVAPISLEGCD